MKKFFMVCVLAFAGVPVLFAQSRGLTVLSPSTGEALTSFSGSYALVIGESSYYKNTGNRQSWQSLPGVKEDVTEIKQLLEEQGFSVTLLEDKTSRELKNGIEDFFNSYGYDSDSRLVVYYAGHGQTLKKERTKTRDMGYIVPIDCPPDAQDEVGFMQLAIPMDQFDSWAKSIRSRHVLFLFDSCFSGTIFTVSRAAPGIIDRSISQPVRQFITSGSEDETVPDISNFRRELVRALRDSEADYNKDGYVSGSELGQYIQNTVTDSVQSPQYGKINNRDLNRGDFIFSVGARQQVNPTDGARRQVDLASITHELELGNISIASGALRINTTTAGHLSILINNTNQDIGDLPGNATLPIP
jgi:hypothetical protein